MRTRTVPRQGGTPLPEEHAVRDPGGRTEIGARVVERTAARAVCEVPGAGAVRSRAVRAKVSGDAVLLRLRIAVRYPHPVRETARRVRGHVRDRVERTTGKRVHHIDIEIVELVR